MKFSIIVGFRNREIDRITKSLNSLADQSFKDFELIFIDYGSDEQIASTLEPIINNYSFAKYIYSDTRGWFWNRAHALNTGTKIAKGEILVFYDIDLIIEQDFVQKLTQLDFENSFHTFSCFYLPEGFELENKDLKRDGIHYEQNYVGLCAVKKNHVVDICGFDEYFMVWGAEDDDFYNRLNKVGLVKIQKSAVDYKVFHQWHKSDSPNIPSPWYIEMVHYLSKKRYSANPDIFKWGKLILQSDRFIKSETAFDLTIKANSGANFLIFNELIDAIHNPAIKSVYFSFINFEPDIPFIKRLFSNSKKNKKIRITTPYVLLFLQHLLGTCRFFFKDYHLEYNLNKVDLLILKSGDCV